MNFHRILEVLEALASISSTLIVNSTDFTSEVEARGQFTSELEAIHSFLKKLEAAPPFPPLFHGSSLE